MNENNTISETNVSEAKADLIFEENGTYCKLGSLESGILEVDLQSSKQRGKEVRCISFATIGFSTEEDKVVQSEMLIMNEEHFNKFKAFIAKLNWND